MKTVSSRAGLLAFASTAALLAFPIAASAQSAPSQDPDSETVEDVIVTGTRIAGRTRLDTIAPVDVISGETLAETGAGTETAAALAQSAPSVNFPRPAISDGSDHVRPATLRGLAPDQTLVLINGQRAHNAALLNVNGALGRGSTAFDLNTIPTVTLGSVEVLRDGASAQYGSDAIAGVINLRLREARDGGGLTVNYGTFDTDFKTARGRHSRSDGQTGLIAGWVGLPIGDEGFLTVSGEVQDRNPTNRSDFADPGAVNGGSATTTIGRFGDPEVENQSVWFNSGLPLSADWEAYAFGGYQNKDSISAATARAFNDARNVPAIYPNGFLPKIATEIQDYNAFGGIRGAAAGIDWDFALGYGKNVIDYRVVDSLNTSYGAASKTSFDAGGLEYDQLTVGIDGVRPLEVGLAQPLNLAFGLEYRRESYQVKAGEPASYNSGGVAGAALGSQGFPGFQPANETDVDRNSWSAFVDVEGNLTEALTVGFAARYEDYSDFGEKLTGKVSARYDFSPGFALRGAVSTGFKAPTLQHQEFSYKSTRLVATTTGVSLVESGYFSVDDPVALALGSRPLESESSTNFSVGAVFRADRLELTIDAYHIDIDDRIVLSEILGGTGSRAGQSATQAATVAAFLAPLNVSAAQFFLNGVDTETSGVDVVGRYRIPTDDGRVDLTLAANFNRTEVTGTPPSPNTAFSSSPFFLFDRANILAFEEGTPELKILAGMDWDSGPFGLNAKATYYDSVLIANNSSTLDYDTGDSVLFDLEGSYDVTEAITFAVGATNLTDEYPDFTPTTVNGATGSVGFPQYSPYGFNGRFLYARLSYNW